MTKMAAMLKYGKKKTSKIFYRTNRPMIMKLVMEQYVIKLYKDYLNKANIFLLIDLRDFFQKIWCEGGK